MNICGHKDRYNKEWLLKIPGRSKTGYLKETVAAMLLQWKGSLRKDHRNNFQRR